MFTATVVNEANALYVHVHTTLDAHNGVRIDRKDVMGFVLSKKHGALAQRLVRAIEAGRVHTVRTVATDVYGKTFLLTSANVLGRTLNADLKRLGF
jgi:hypothetical protein